MYIHEFKEMFERDNGLIPGSVWIASCNCGWHTGPKLTEQEAHDDLDQHIADETAELT